MTLDALTGSGAYGHGPVLPPRAPAEAVVAVGANATGDGVYVLTPGATQRTGPCRWTERIIDGAVFLPAEGDPCVVVRPAEGHHLLEWWEPAAQRTGVPVGVSVGDVKWTARTTAPAGWLACDGSALAPGLADRLRQALLDDGAPYGMDGDDPLLPDLQGRNAIGAGAGTGLTSRAAGDTGGTETHVLTTAQMPSHAHQQITGFGPGTRAMSWDGVGHADYGDGDTGLTGGGLAHPNMAPWLALTAIIRT